ncbi:hypothetical protein MesoLj131a_61800 [Mesorhizobium sp. 131-2-1]|nr:hypothetical protein MesoLj131a_61800 [Mesorhizobium sp. 131-2-1]BCH04387.1 hypothetical protein MesoLj131b_63860 [Mesorhizobium sp. 131-2-5]
MDDQGLRAGRQPDRVIRGVRGNAIGGMGIVGIDNDFVLAHGAAQPDESGGVVDDAADLGTGLSERARGIDADHPVGAALRGEVEPVTTHTMM